MVGLLGAAADGPPEGLPPVRGAAALSLPLAAGQSAAALVWDERYWWCIVQSRANAYPVASPPTGEEVRYLGEGIALPPADVAAYRGRGGRRAPGVTRPPGGDLGGLARHPVTAHCGA